MFIMLSGGHSVFETLLSALAVTIVSDYYPCLCLEVNFKYFLFQYLKYNIGIRVCPVWLVTWMIETDRQIISGKALD